MGLGRLGLRLVGCGDRMAGGCLAMARVSLPTRAERVSFGWAELAGRNKLRWEMWECGNLIGK